MSFCRKEPNRTYREDVVSGFKTIHNFEKQILIPIEFAPDLSLGFDETNADAFFERPVDLDVETDGNIYVLDRKALAIKKFDAQGRFIKKIGGAGQGPGEFELPFSIRLDKQRRIYCLDGMRKTILVFNPEGMYLRSIKFLHSVYGFDVTRRNEILLHFSIDDENLRNRSQRVDKIARFDDQGNLLGEICSVERYFYERISSAPFVFTLPCFLRWNIQGQGNLCIGKADRYEFKIYSPDGVLQSGFEKEYKPFSLEPETRKKVLEILDRLKSDKEKVREYAEHYEIFNWVSSDEKNRIWVELFQPDLPDKLSTSSLYDVFSADGKYLFSTQVPNNVKSRLVFKSGHVYFLSANAEGNIGILRMKVQEKAER